MSVAALAATPMEELIESYRGLKINKTQVIAALVAAGATAGGAALLVQAVDSSNGTPAPTPAVSASAHNHMSGISATNQTALHQRHIGMQGGN
jgi:hypothetical protein